MPAPTAVSCCKMLGAAPGARGAPAAIQRRRPSSSASGQGQQAKRRQRPLSSTVQTRRTRRWPHSALPRKGAWNCLMSECSFCALPCCAVLRCAAHCTRLANRAGLAWVLLCCGAFWSATLGCLPCMGSSASPSYSVWETARHFALRIPCGSAPCCCAHSCLSTCPAPLPTGRSSVADRALTALARCAALRCAPAAARSATSWPTCVA